MENSKKPLFELKELLKCKATVIKQAKIDLKNAAKAGEHYSKFQYKIMDEKREFRHNLIAYCELRGLKREQIEKPAENNLPNESVISNIKSQYVLPERKMEATNV